MMRSIRTMTILLAVILALRSGTAAGAPLSEAELKALLKQGQAAQAAGKFAEAETMYLEAWPETKRLFGEGSLPEAAVLKNLGELYGDTGRAHQGEPLMRRALLILEKNLEEDHPLTLRTVNNLGLVSTAAGKYVEAEKLFQRALADIARLKQEETLLHATVLNNLAELHRALSQDEKAEPLFKHCLEIKEDRLGKNNPSIATTLNNLAELYRDNGRYKEAEPLYERCREILDTPGGRNAPLNAIVLNNLGELYRQTGRYKEAEPLLKRCREILETRLGKNHPAVAQTLQNLGGLYKVSGQYELAEPLLRQSLEMFEKQFGPDHPMVAQGLHNLGGLYWATGQVDQAVSNFGRGRRGAQQYDAHVLTGLGEREQLDFLQRTDGFNLQAALTLAVEKSDNAKLVSESASWLLNWKGLGHQIRAQGLLAARDSRDPQMGRDVEELLDLRRQLARLTLQGAAPGFEGPHRKTLADLAGREQTLARGLQQRGAAVAVPAWVEMKQVQEVLPAGAVFVDVGRFDTFDAVQEKFKVARYGAWITPKAGPTRLIDLGAAKAIDDAVAEVRKALEDAAKVLKAEGEIKAEKAVREPLARLAKLVLAPLRPHLNGADRWVISPDGNLWLVPWAALPLDEKTYAVEKHAIQLVISGRDLLPRAGAPGKTTAPAILADPDYGEVAPQLGGTRGLADLKLGRIPRLPGTATEAAAVAELIEKVFGQAPRLLSEEKATVAALLALKRPRALALATHGFFLPNQELDPEERDRFLRNPRARATNPGEDPLLRCGLLLAGCNKPGDAGRAGVLTGREVLSADLRGCELVILSACQTALGDVRNGEGVAGLRQAFQLAGAESVLASLWQVPDDETTLQMTAFMDAQAAGKDRVEALAQAQRQRITQRREKFGAAHPFNWAAFTLTGSAGSQR
jgi:CHAT domain-containing protein/Tfp pilus assembly protein PilF